MYDLETTKYCNVTLAYDNSCLNNSMPMLGGLYDNSNNFIQTSGFTRFNKQMIHPTSLIEPQIYLNGQYIFAGYLFHHFGHFILESLSRIWFYNISQLPCVWTTAYKYSSRLEQYQIDILKILGIDNPIFIDRCARIDNIFVPSVSVAIPDLITDTFCNFLKKFDSSTHTLNIPMLWLSRSDIKNNFSSDRNTENRSYQYKLETQLQHKGWNIFHPHHHSIDNQLTTISQSKIVAGFESSAFHNLLLLNNYSGKVLMFNRGRKIPSIHYLIQKKRPDIHWKIIDEYPSNISQIEYYT